MKAFFNRFKKTSTAAAAEQAVDPREAPVELRGKVTGVKGFNKAGLYAAVGVVTAGVLVSFYLGGQGKDQAALDTQKQASRAIDEKSKAEESRRNADWMGVIPDGVLTVKKAPEAAPPLILDTPAAPVQGVAQVPDLTGGATALAGPAAQPVPPTAEELRRAQLAQRAQAKEFSAYDATPGVGGFSQGAAPAAPGPNPYAAGAKVGGFGGMDPAQLAALAAAAGGNDANLQARKAAFVVEAASKSEDFYLKSLKETALSKFELKAGGLIPGVMLSGINSDLPGQVTGQVREDVYDTLTGKNLMIPKGTRLVGTYDSQVAFGQSRVLMVWSRMIFPDASSFDLKGMQGADGQGYSGFSDEVNNHYGKLVGGAILLSVVSAANAVTAPSGSGNQTQTPGQAAAAAGMGAVTQIGGQWAGKQLSVQPTLEIRPGYTFNIMVNRDMVFPGAYHAKK